MHRSTWIRAAVLAGLSLALGTPGWAQEPFPARPIKLIVPYPPGASTDNMARGFAQELSKALHPPVVVENTPGAGTAIAALALKAAPADGYTLLFETENIFSAKLANPGLAYEASDFETITPLAQTPYALVVPAEFQINTLDDLKAHAAKKNKELDFGTLGNGPTLYNVLSILLSQHLGVKPNLVPYKGGMEGITAVMAGQIDGYWSTVSLTYSQKDNAKLRTLALASDGSKNPFFPDVKSFKDLGMGDVVYYSRYGVAIRAGTPEAIRKQLKEVARRVSDSPELKQIRRQISLEDYTGTTEEFDAQTKASVQNLNTVYEQAQKRQGKNDK
jgi:tripartite-type tricarboxylate transporter receptor subunit TctC